MGETPKNGGGKKTQLVSLDDASVEALGEKIKSKSREKRPRSKNEWRSIFAFILLVGFLLIIGFIVVSDQVWGAHTDASDLITTVGTLISSPLSFVIGYYYNKDKTNS